MVDPRERRMQRLKEERRAELPKTVAKNVAIGVVALLVVGGLGYAIYASTQGEDDCPGHWHATVGVFVNGDRVRFPQPPYVIGGEGGVLGLSMHMHTGNDEQLHFEPTPRKKCLGVEDTMNDLGVELSGTRMALVDAHEDLPHGGTYRENETHKLRFFLQQGESRVIEVTADEDQREVTWSDIADYQMRDGEKFLIAYGDYTDEEIDLMMDQISWPPGADPRHGEA